MDCQQLSIDNDWSLARTNACHIAVQNEETGLIWDELTSMNMKIDHIATLQGFNLWIWAAVGLAIISLVIKKMWGK